MVHVFGGADEGIFKEQDSSRSLCCTDANARTRSLVSCTGSVLKSCVCVTTATETNFTSICFPFLLQVPFSVVNKAPLQLLRNKEPYLGLRARLKVVSTSPAA